MAFDRRDFLRAACCSALGTGWLGRLQAASPTFSGTTEDYRALVCVFLDGGADTHSFVVPTGSTGNGASDYNVYAASRGNMAIPQGDLLPFGDGTFGMHPNLAGLRDLYDSGRLAMIANAGTLIQPLSKADWQAGNTPLPPQLFSHSDQSQQWQTAHADATAPTGWCGRVADQLTPVYGHPQLSMNISAVGNNLLQVGNSVVPYSVSQTGPIGPSLGYGDDAVSRRQLLEGILNDSGPHILESEYARVQRRAIDNFDLIDDALASLGDLNAAFPLFGNDNADTGAGETPTTGFDRQLRIVAAMIAIRAALGVSRQTFVVRLGGWDTHDNQLADLPARLQELNKGLEAFFGTTQTLGVENLVTSYCFTEFGRTLNSNGSGTDHGWGGHQFVLGGAVQGGQIVGTMPDLTIDGPDDTGRGRLIPTTGVEQVAATLASWFGLDPGLANTVFPNLSNFPSSDLGFMA